jgi:transcriptional regulator with XRE-family HTH domain
MRFGEALRETRERAGMSRRELADAAGVPFGTIHGYEDGRRAPSFANVVRLAKALGTDCTAFSECEDMNGTESAEEEAQTDTPSKGKAKPDKGKKG